MLVDLVMPDLGLQRGSAVVSLWLVRVGTVLMSGDAVLEVVADGVTVDIPTPVDGVLHKVFVGEDEPLAAGRRLGVIRTSDDAAS